MTVLKRGSLAAIVIAAAVLPLAACSGAEEEPQAPAAPAFRLSLPFDQYQWTRQEKQIQEHARYRLVGQCVRDQGIDFTMPEPSPAAEALSFYDNSRRYGVLDEVTVASFGYHLPRTEEGKDRQKKNNQWNTKVPMDEEKAIYGTGEDDAGCYGKADAELTKGVPVADTEWLGDKNELSLDETEKSDAVVRAKAAWKDCMAGQGFSYDVPRSASGDLKWKLDLPKITDEEREVALADVRCKHSTGLVTAWQEAETAWQKQLIAGEPERFRQLQAAKDATLAAARRISA